MEEIIKEIFQYGGTVIMAGLFVYVFFQDRIKNNSLLQAISKSNENIAKSLEIISENLSTTDSKLDRNYEAIVKGGKI